MAVEYTNALPILDRIGTFWSLFENRPEVATMISSVQDKDIDLNSRVDNINEILAIESAKPYLTRYETFVDPLKWQYYSNFLYYNHGRDLYNINQITNTINSTHLEDGNNNRIVALKSETLYAMTMTTLGSILGKLDVTSIQDEFVGIRKNSDNTITFVENSNIPEIGYAYNSSGAAIKYGKIATNKLKILEEGLIVTKIAVKFTSTTVGYANQPDALPYNGTIETSNGNISYEGINYKTGQLYNLTLDTDISDAITAGLPDTYTVNGTYDPYRTMDFKVILKGRWFFKELTEINSAFYKLWGAMIDKENYLDLIDVYDIKDLIPMLHYTISCYKKTFSIKKLNNLVNILHGVPFSRKDDSVLNIVGDDLYTVKGEAYSKHSGATWSVVEGEDISKFDILVTDLLQITDSTYNNNLTAGIKFATELCTYRPDNFDTYFNYNQSFINNVLAKILPRSTTLSLTSQTQSDVLFEKRLGHDINDTVMAFAALSQTANFSLIMGIKGDDYNTDMSFIESNKADPSTDGLQIYTESSVLKIRLNKSTIVPTPISWDITLTPSRDWVLGLNWRSTDQKLEIYYNGILIQSIEAMGLKYYTHGESLTLNPDLATIANGQELYFLAYSKIPLDSYKMLEYNDYLKTVYPGDFIQYEITAEESLEFHKMERNAFLNNGVGLHGYTTADLTGFYNFTDSKIEGITHTSDTNATFRLPLAPFVKEKGTSQTYYTWRIIFRTPPIENIDELNIPICILDDVTSGDDLIVTIHEDTGTIEPELWQESDGWNYEDDILTTMVAPSTDNGSANSTTEDALLVMDITKEADDDIYLSLYESGGVTTIKTYTGSYDLENLRIVPNHTYPIIAMYLVGDSPANDVINYIAYNDLK